MENGKIFETEFNKWAIDKDDMTEKFKQNNMLLQKVYPDKDFKQLNALEYRKEWYFKNKYGISVIRGYGTYGIEKGLFEVGVLLNKRLDYDTSITDDVIGHLTSQEVLDLGKRIRELVTPVSD